MFKYSNFLEILFSIVHPDPEIFYDIPLVKSYNLIIKLSLCCLNKKSIPLE